MMRALLEHHYTLNMRELEAAVRARLAPPELQLTEEPAPAWSSATSPSTHRSDSGRASDSLALGAGSGGKPIHSEKEAQRELTPQKIQRCLDENNGVLELAWRALGLPNRFALRRLIKKYQLEVRRRPKQTRRRRSHDPR
jgi:transcriptional regulator with GAF, ATPase, and Fis domain